MQSGIWGYLFLFIGLFGLALINLFGSVIISNEQNYYLLKEITEAAMIDAVDLKAYREGVGWDGVTEELYPEDMHCMANIPGTVRIIKQKFVESFLMRFADSVHLNKNYRITIRDIDECPPKVSITIESKERSLLSNVSSNYDSEQNVVNTLTGILEKRTIGN